MRKVENITGLVYEVDWSKTISGEALLSLFVCLFGIQTLDAIIEEWMSLGYFSFSRSTHNLKKSSSWFWCFLSKSADFSKPRGSFFSNFVCFSENQNFTKQETGLERNHTIYPGNNMCQKCGRKTGLWVLHEIVNKTYAENI